jgi:hypothetical protein
MTFRPRRRKIQLDVYSEVACVDAVTEREVKEEAHFE